MKAVAAMLRDEQGATMVEYAIVLALLSAVSLAALALIGTNANTQLSNDQTNMTTVQTSP
jgi:Flp pilus assembly pilin Flp